MNIIKKILSQPVESVGSIGEARKNGFARLNIYTLHDLLYHFPRRYEDRRIVSLDNIELYGKFAVCLKVNSKPNAIYAKSYPIIKFTASEVARANTAEDGAAEVSPDEFEETGKQVDIAFFNADYLKSVFKQGNIYIFYGKISANFVKYEMVNPKFEPYYGEEKNTPFYPVYRKNPVITQNIIIKSLDSVFRLIKNNYDELDFLPEYIRNKYNLCSIGFALQNIHNPKSEHELKMAKDRFIFEDFFLYSFALGWLKSRREFIPAHKYEADIDMGEFYSALPFTLTSAQQRAIDEIIGDMTAQIKPMNRLVQGDVGSGKTMIAAAAAFFACRNGTQTAMMAPTDILATQHFESLSELFKKFGLRTCLLTGSLKAKEKRETLEAIEKGSVDFIIGTHSVIQKNVNFFKLSLAITDEQHRFGVNQRATMESKSALVPHTLVMSATPIPRTLALIMYGDLEVSIVNELPPGRQKIDTYAVGSSYRQRIYDFTRKLISEGGLAFIVCPLVGEDDDEDDIPLISDSSAISNMKSVKAYYKELSEKIYPDIKLGFIHGKMRAEEKDSIMEQFKNREIKILVSTVVIEVGVNIPDAVLMIIENAERFGLSQLHQLRGRVGRGNKKSYCVLFSDNESENSKKRLDIMCKTNDGFEIAKKDIEIRGPGDLFGEKQSGNVKFKLADLAVDTEILYTATKAAKEALEKNPNLDNPENERLKRAVIEMFHADAPGRIAFN